MSALGIAAVTRRAALGGRWRSPEGEEKKAAAVEETGDPVYRCGQFVGVRARYVEVVWSDGTRTPVRDVADPRFGWKAILAVEER